MSLPGNVILNASFIFKAWFFFSVFFTRFYLGLGKVDSALEVAISSNQQQQQQQQLEMIINKWAHLLALLSITKLHSSSSILHSNRPEIQSKKPDRQSWHVLIGKHRCCELSKLNIHTQFASTTWLIDWFVQRNCTLTCKLPSSHSKSLLAFTGSMTTMIMIAVALN